MEVRFPSQKRTLNVIFQMNFRNVDQGGDIMEFDWIRNVILGEIDRPIQIWSSHENKRMADSLIVFLHAPKDEHTYFQGCCPNMGLYHMGDESGSQNTAFYGRVNYVFRNYYFHKFKDQPNTHYVALGTKSGFGTIPSSSLMPADRRRTLCNFIGSLRSNRAEMVQVVRDNNLDCYMSANLVWGSRDGLPPLNYRQILADSVFTLTPWGNNPESLRIYEALEAGSIPIYQKHENDFVEFALGPNPIPTLNSWKEMPELIKSLMEDKPKLLKLQGDLIAWWRQYKIRLQQKVKRVIDESFFKTYGDNN